MGRKHAINKAEGGIEKAKGLRPGRPKGHARDIDGESGTFRVTALCCCWCGEVSKAGTIVMMGPTEDTSICEHCIRRAAMSVRALRGIVVGDS